MTCLQVEKFLDFSATMLIRGVLGVIVHFQKDLEGETFPISVGNCGFLEQILHTGLVLRP